MHVKEVFRGLQSFEMPGGAGPVDCVVQAVRDVFADGSPYRGVHASYLLPNGDANEFQLTLVPIHDTGDQVTAVLCLVSPAFTLSLLPAEAASTVSKAE
jgi:hypothetical protein